ncbi:calcium-binding protein [Dongia sp.]|uniref:calcium-binding protein n=1 Tax=Dongia sp. TaxID=1977262 RepID=UPI0037503D51
MTTTRSTTNNVLDPKLVPDQLGIAAASSGPLFDVTNTIYRPATHGLPPAPKPESHDLAAPSPDIDELKIKHPDTGHHDGDTIFPLPDPVFLAPGLFPINGTAGNDDLDGTDAGDIINGLGGEDLITGGDGYDTIDGGGDADEIYGDSGNDYIEGGTGDDALFGDGDQSPELNGNDFLSGGEGEDVLSGMGGNDWLFGGDDTDTLFGGEGDDTLVGSMGGADTMYGNEGADAFVSIDDIAQPQPHTVVDYSAAQGDTVEGDSWTFNAGTNSTTVFDGGAALFVLQSYNAGVSGINFTQYDPAPPA